MSVDSALRKPFEILHEHMKNNPIFRKSLGDKGYNANSWEEGRAFLENYIHWLQEQDWIFSKDPSRFSDSERQEVFSLLKENPVFHKYLDELSDVGLQNARQLLTDLKEAKDLDTPQGRKVIQFYKLWLTHEMGLVNVSSCSAYFLEAGTSEEKDPTALLHRQKVITLRESLEQSEKQLKRWQERLENLLAEKAGFQQTYILLKKEVFETVGEKSKKLKKKETKFKIQPLIEKIDKCMETFLTKTNVSDQEREKFQKLSQLRVQLVQLQRIEDELKAKEEIAQERIQQYKQLIHHLTKDVTKEKKAFEHRFAALLSERHGKLFHSPLEQAKGLVRAIADDLQAESRQLAELEQNLAPQVESIQKILEKLDEEIENTQEEDYKQQLQGQKERMAEEKHRLEVELAEVRAKQKSLKEQAKLIEDILAQMAGEMGRLVLEAEKIKREMKILKSLPKIPKAINVYCSFYSMSVKPIAAIGALVISNDPEEEKTLQTEEQEKKSLMERMKGWLKKHSPDIHKLGYNTGALEIALTLGLGVGAGASDLEAKLGLALTFQGTLEYGSGRTFQSISTLELKAVGEAKIPKLLSFSLEYELYTSTTAHTFVDHYHWASWLCQKWARVWAIVRACDVYPISIHQTPSPEDLAQIYRYAQQYLADPAYENVQATLREIRYYQSLPLVKMESKNLLDRVNVSLSMGEGLPFIGSILGQELSVATKPTKVTYTRRATGDDGNVLIESFTREIYEEEKVEYTKSFDTTISPFGVKIALSYSSTWTENQGVKSEPEEEFELGIDLHSLPSSQRIASLFTDEKNLSNIPDGKWHRHYDNYSPETIVSLGHLLEEFVNALFVNDSIAPSDFIESKINPEFLRHPFWQTIKKLGLRMVKAGFRQIKWKENGKVKKSWTLQYLRPLGVVSLSHEFSWGQGVEFSLGAEFSKVKGKRERLSPTGIWYLKDIYAGLYHPELTVDRLRQFLESVQYPLDQETVNYLKKQREVRDKIWEKFVEHHRLDICHQILELGDSSSTIRKVLQAESGDAITPLLQEATKLYQKFTELRQQGQLPDHSKKDRYERLRVYPFGDKSQWERAFSLLTSYLKKVLEEERLEGRESWRRKKIDLKVLKGINKYVQKAHELLDTDFYRKVEKLWSEFRGKQRKTKYLKRKMPIDKEHIEKVLRKCRGNLEEARALLTKECV